jgi:ribosome recycling factor
MEELNQAFADARAAMEKALEHLEHELAKLRTGKA